MGSCVAGCRSTQFIRMSRSHGVECALAGQALVLQHHQDPISKDPCDATGLHKQARNCNLEER